MTAPTLTIEQRLALELEEERPLTAAEFDARVNAPWTKREREDFDALVTWFNRRYPTALERLQATRHLADQWRANGVWR